MKSDFKKIRTKTGGTNDNSLGSKFILKSFQNKLKKRKNVTFDIQVRHFFDLFSKGIFCVSVVYMLYLFCISFLCLLDSGRMGSKEERRRTRGILELDSLEVWGEDQRIGSSRGKPEIDSTGSKA